MAGQVPTDPLDTLATPQPLIPSPLLTITPNPPGMCRAPYAVPCHPNHMRSRVCMRVPSTCSIHALMITSHRQVEAARERAGGALNCSVD